MSGCVTNTPSVSLTVDGGILEAVVNISGMAGNELVEEADGLYVASTPAGAVIFFAGAAAPTGWLLCNGQAVSRTTYAALFAAIGVVYGVGNGSTTFNVPDLRGRVPVGVGTHSDVSALNDTEGDGVDQRTPIHDSSNHVTAALDTVVATIPFYHAGNAGPLIGASDGLSFVGDTTAPVTGSVDVGGTIGPAGSRPTDTPAFVTFNGIIKT